MKNPMILLALTVLTLVGGAGACFYQYGSMSDAEASLLKLKAEDKDEKTLKEKFAAVQELLDTSTLKLNHLEQSVSQAEYVPTLLKELENIGKAHGITVSGVRPIPKQAAPAKKGEKERPERKPYIELDIEVNGRGNYRSVLNFVNALQTFPKIVAARTVSLQPKKLDKEATQDNLDATIVLRTYVFAPPQAPTKTALKTGSEDSNHG